MVMILKLQTGYAASRPGLTLYARGCLDFPDILQRRIGLIVSGTFIVYEMREIFVVSQLIVRYLMAFTIQNIWYVRLFATLLGLNSYCLDLLYEFHLKGNQSSDGVAGRRNWYGVNSCTEPMANRSESRSSSIVC